jgi:hypothetical protein
MNKLVVASAMALLPMLASAGDNCSSLQNYANNAYNKPSFLIANKQNFLTCKSQCTTDSCNQAFQQLIYDANYAYIYQGISSNDSANSVSNNFGALANTANNNQATNTDQANNNADNNNDDDNQYTAPAYTAPTNQPVTVKPQQTKKSNSGGIRWF